MRKPMKIDKPILIVTAILIAMGAGLFGNAQYKKHQKIKHEKAVAEARNEREQRFNQMLLEEQKKVDDSFKLEKKKLKSKISQYEKGSTNSSPQNEYVELYEKCEPKPKTSFNPVTRADTSKLKECIGKIDAWANEPWQYSVETNEWDDTKILRLTQKDAPKIEETRREPLSSHETFQLSILGEKANTGKPKIEFYCDQEILRFELRGGFKNLGSSGTGHYFSGEIKAADLQMKFDEKLHGPIRVAAQSRNLFHTTKDSDAKMIFEQAKGSKKLRLRPSQLEVGSINFDADNTALQTKYAWEKLSTKEALSYVMVFDLNGFENASRRFISDCSHLK